MYSRANIINIFSVDLVRFVCSVPSLSIFGSLNSDINRTAESEPTRHIEKLPVLKLCCIFWRIWKHEPRSVAPLQNIPLQERSEHNMTNFSVTTQCIFCFHRTKLSQYARPYQHRAERASSEVPYHSQTIWNEGNWKPLCELKAGVFCQPHICSYGYSTPFILQRQSLSGCSELMGWDKRSKAALHINHLSVL